MWIKKVLARVLILCMVVIILAVFGFVIVTIQIPVWILSGINTVESMDRWLVHSKLQSYYDRISNFAQGE